MEKSTKQILAALSYPFWPVGIVSLVVAEKDKDLAYHGMQGLIFGLLSTLIIYVLNMVIYPVFYSMYMITNLLWIAFLVLAIIYALKAYNGEQFKVPIVYDIMTKIKK